VRSAAAPGVFGPETNQDFDPLAVSPLSPYNDGMRPLLLRLLASSILLASPAAAAVFEAATLAPALDMAASAPAFRASVLSQIQVVSSLSAQPTPSLVPILSAAPTPADPYRAEAARFVGALAAQPAAVAEAAAPLRAAFGDQPIDQLQKAASRIQTKVAAHPELAGQLAGLREGLDLSNPAALQEYASRLNALFDNSRPAAPASEGSAVAVDGPSTHRPLVSLLHHGEKPALSESELEAYVNEHAVVTPRGMKRVNFASGDYKPQYDAALRRLGADLVVIKTPSRAEVQALHEEDGYHLKSEYERWVMPVRDVDEHMAALAKPDRQRQFRKALATSDGVPTKIGPLTVAQYEQWYKIYEDEVVGKPGGKRNVALDFARKLEEKGQLGEGKEWYGLFFYDKDDPAKMLGGVVMKAAPERGMFILGYAAYRPELKDANPMTRVFVESAKLAKQLGYKVLSFGQDTNFFGYDYSLGLMGSKSGFLLSPYPEDEIVLMKVLDTSKIASVKNGQGKSGGYFFFGIKRDSQVTQRYLASRDAGTPKEAQELLGSDHYFDGQVDASKDVVVGRHFRGDDPNALRVPVGIDVLEAPMAPPNDGN
jgi:hypothetical protein